MIATDTNVHFHVRYNLLLFCVEFFDFYLMVSQPAGIWASTPPTLRFGGATADHLSYFVRKIAIFSIGVSSYIILHIHLFAILHLLPIDSFSNELEKQRHVLVMAKYSTY